MFRFIEVVGAGQDEFLTVIINYPSFNELFREIFYVMGGKKSREMEIRHLHSDSDSGEGTDHRGGFATCSTDGHITVLGPAHWICNSSKEEVVVLRTQ